MSVLVVVPAHEAAAHLAATIDSVRAQTRTDWRLVVVDDGSRDTTGTIAAGFAARDARITCTAQPNAGVAAARNRGLLAAGPDVTHYLFLDHDDVLEPDALAVLGAALDADPAAVGVHGLMRCVDVAGSPVEAASLERWQRERVAIEDGRVVPWPSDRPTTFRALALGNRILTMGQSLLRRDPVDAAGGFDPATVPADDYDLYLRLLAGGHLAFVARVVVAWRLHERNVSHDRQRMEAATARVQRKLARTLGADEGRLLLVGYRLARRGLARLALDAAKDALARGAVGTATAELRRVAVNWARAQWGRP